MNTSKEARSFQINIRPNRVFILGAGFSAGAGVPLTIELLREALKLFFAECPGIYSRVERYARQSMGLTSNDSDISTVSFSKLCTFLEFIELTEYGGGERWSENGSREKLALRFYLAKVLVARTPKHHEIPELYRAFAAQLHPQDFVISFNWDGLLEAAIEAVGKRYSYNVLDENVIYISKLHGSVNWRLGEPNQWGKPSRTLPWSKIDFGSGMMERSLYSSAELLRFEAWSAYQPLGEVDPYLVLPGYGKAFDVRANAPLWYKPGNMFAFSHHVFIIGLSIAPDDFFVRSLFLSTLPYIEDYSREPDRKIVVINPSNEAHHDYEFILAKSNAELWNENFCLEHVDRIRADKKST